MLNPLKEGEEVAVEEGEEKMVRKRRRGGEREEEEKEGGGGGRRRRREEKDITQVEEVDSSSMGTHTGPTSHWVEAG